MKYLLIFFFLAALLLVNIELITAQAETEIGVIVAAESMEHISLNAFTNAIPSTWLTPPDAYPRYRIEIVPSVTNDGICAYTVRDLNGNVVDDVNVDRERLDIQITIIDLETKKQIASEAFIGNTPSGCAINVSCSNDQGHVSCANVTVMPDAAAFATWLTAMMSELPDLEASRSSDIVMVFTEPDESIAGAIYDPSGRFVLTYSDDRVSIWDAAAGEKVRQLEGNYVYTSGIDYSPDGHFIMTLLGVGWVTIWDASTGQQLREVPPPPAPPTQVILTARYSPDGHFILTREGHNWAAIRDASTGEEVRQLTPNPHSYDMLSAAYSLDGQFIVTGNSDDTARIWDASTGEEVRQLVAHTGVVWNASYSPDGRFIVTASSDKTVRIWDAATGEELRQLNGHTDEVARSSYSPDGRFIVTTSSDKTVRIWDAATGEGLRTLSNHGYWLRGAAYSPDGRFILATSSDGTAIIWDVSDLLTAS